MGSEGLSEAQRETARKRKRLSAEADTGPWVAAPQNGMNSFLFWLPVSGFPLTLHEKTWVGEFLARFGAALKREHGLRGEIFLEHGLLSASLRGPLLRHLQDQPRAIGLGRASDTEPAQAMTEERTEQVLKENRPVAAEDLSGRLLIWFPRKRPQQQWELFGGDGCMLWMFLPPDPKTVPPKMPFTPALRAAHPAFQRMDVDGMIEGTFAMQDSFLPRSKQLLGKGLAERPEFAAIQFLLPAVEAADVFAADEDLRGRWFQLMEVYVRESRKDAGVLLLFHAEKYLPVLVGVLAEMTAEGLSFEPKRGGGR